MRDFHELMLGDPPLTLAAAESLTCGHVQARLGAQSGTSKFFLGGITAYSVDEKVKHLGVDRAEAEACDCVSSGVARQMARGACEFFNAQIAVATTGYAEPAPDRGAREPMAWWALAHRLPKGDWKTLCGRVVCPGMKRVEVQRAVADAVFAELVGYLRAFRASPV